MASHSFSKFVRPAAARAGPITDRDIDILDTILRYRFASSSEIVRLVGGNEDVTQRRLRRLWERGLVNRWAFPGIRAHSEFHYYLDQPGALDLLLASGRITGAHPQMLEEIRNNRAKAYAQAAVRGQYMQLGFLKHHLMLSRMHFMLEKGSRTTQGGVHLEEWRQGGQLAGHKAEVPRIRASRQAGRYFCVEGEDVERLPVEPDALFTLRCRTAPGEDRRVHFLYEADRGTMIMTDMLKKLRAYYHFIKRQQGHEAAFAVHPVRAVLIETTDEARCRRLMQLAQHPLVSGGSRRTGLFWFTISPLFSDPLRQPVGARSPRTLPRYLEQPEIVLDRIWALPDRSLHALTDPENH